MSGNDAGLFKTEIAVLARSGRADNDVIDQLQLEDSARFKNPAGEPQIRFRRGGISAYAVCGITGVIPHPVLCRMATGFSKSGQRPDAA